MQLLGPARLAALVSVSALFLALLPGMAMGNHVQCGDVITQDTTLDSDLLNCPADGIVVAGDGVTIDLAGHTVDGQGNGAGIAAEPFVAALTVTGGTVREFADGVNAVETDGLSVADSVVERNTRWGVLCESSSECVLRSAVVRDNGFDGLWLLFSSGEVTDSVVTGNGAGVQVSEGTLRVVRGSLIARNEVGVAGQGMAVVERNRIVDNLRAGIAVSYGDRRATIRDNRITGNLNGIEVDGEAADISGNLIADNTSNGVLGLSNDRIRLTGNTIAGNGEYGFRAFRRSCFEAVVGNMIARNGAGGVLVETEEADCDGAHEIARNRVGRNGGDGIAVRNTFLPVTIEGNRADRNADDGIDVDAPVEGGAPVTVARNRADHNGELGINARPGVIDGGGNRARGNGNPAQCVGVSCK
jgi:Right handed beta helix region